MVTDMISLKLDDEFLGEIDTIVRKEGYQSRTEFIRNALREKVEESKLKQAMIELASLKGAAKKKITEKEYENTRKKAFEALSKKVR